VTGAGMHGQGRVDAHRARQVTSSVLVLPPGLVVVAGSSAVLGV
jgi:hypothetical protein